ncbi:MAG TPA: hypothetical protein VJO32_02355 [Ktedonobacteraceae bacterium]|nr:hypothetical protein [Ktedonobacteraceae bacterium]
MKIISEVSNQAEKLYENAIALGDHAAHVLKAAHRAQMTSLENIAESTFKTSDVFDYIKKQTARFPYWRQSMPESQSSPGNEDANQPFGIRLKNYLEQYLKKAADDICDPSHLNIGNTTDKEKQERRRIHLLLMRQSIRQMVAQYEFRVSPVGNMSSSGSNRKG